MSDQFVHLHVHTEYSMLDGAARVSDLFDSAAEMGMPALAVTDHGNMYGAFDFYKAGKAAGVKPIVGCLVAGQEIITSTGVKAVEEVAVGDLVLTHRGRFRSVVQTMRRRYRGRAYTVSLGGRYGRSLTLTEEHPILIRTRDGLVDWRKPGDVVPGRYGAKGGARRWNSWACLPKLATEFASIDLLEFLPGGFFETELGGIGCRYESRFRGDQLWEAVPRQIQLDEDLGWLLGMYAAEGTVTRSLGRLTGGFGFHLNINEREIAEELERICLRFGIALARQERPDKGSLHVYGCNVPIAHLLDALCGHAAKQKRVPMEILNAPEPVRYGFLEGVLLGDGKSLTAMSNSAGKQDLKVASRDLAWGVRTLLADLGHWVGVTESSELVDPPNALPAAVFKYFMISYTPGRSYSRTIEDDEFVYRPIKDVVAHELDCEVFNFEVAEDNSYVSDFVLHNCEAYVAPASRFDRTKLGPDSNKVDKYSHMTLLASSDQGYANLVKLASLASLEGYYYKPRVDRELLSQYADGLIGTSGCLGSEVNQLLLRGDYAGARQTLSDYADIFGRDDYYVEVMDHGIADQERTTPDLIKLARELGLPLLATNDLHYTKKEDSVAHEVLLCVQTGSTIADPGRFKLETPEFYLKSPAEMRALWRDYPEACDNTLLIAERCELTIVEGKDLLPRFDVPEGHTEESWLRAEVARGVQARWGDYPTDDQRARVDFELAVIAQMGFPSYFLVVADLVRHAHENGIRVGPGRGSAAGSAVSYCLGITELDPLQYGLLFERFLNPERVSMPDIDMDFDERRRGDMIRYATEKYGEERVAQIVTFGTIKAKQAIRDSARVLGLPYAVGDRISKLMPAPVMGRDVGLRDCFDPKAERYGDASEMRRAYETSAEDKMVLDTARGLEGLKRQAGVHAAGVVICRDPLTDHIPVWRREADGAIITQFEMKTVEKLGLLKMDFLGLRNLSVLDDCLEHIQANRGETLVLEDQGLEDEAAYDLLCRADSIGVFQLEGGPMRSLMRALQPRCFDDISALIALYRPGPMGVGAHIDFVERKHGRRPKTPIHPELAEPLAEVLDETYGVIVYQEQVMAAAQKVAGYSLGQADLLRRAMGKKDKKILDKEYIPFADGMRAQGFGEAAIAKLWEVLVPFADYAFNKAHSAGYGLVSYWTAYLKANFPSEYMAALLTSVKDNRDASALYLNECRRMGIKVLPPDVNESDLNFTPRGTDIRFGLSAIRNVGENVVHSVIDTRKSKGRFDGFHDFLRKVEGPVCNKRLVESLVKAGAFDSLGHTRKGLLAVHAEAIDACLDTKRAEAMGQFSLFGEVDASAGAGDGMSEIAIGPGEWDKTTLLAFEREMLSLYVSDHPLLGVEHVLAQHADTKVSALTAETAQDGQIVTVAGILSSISKKTTKAGASYAQAVLEDLEGAIGVWFFPGTYATCATLLAADAVLVIKGKLDRREEEAKLIAIEVSRPELSQAPRGPVVLRLDAARCTEPVVASLQDVLRQHPGLTEVHLQLMSGSRRTELKIDDALRVAATPSLFADLKALLGSSCLG